MAKTKRYFWLKLKEDFFNQKEIKLLRKIAGGDTYTIIYLKLLLLSLKNDGKIYFDGLTDEFSEEVALEIDESVENVQVTMQFLQKKGLIAFDTEHQDEFELTNIASMIGSETDKAAMMRRKRAREKEQKQLNGNNVTAELPDRYTEIEKEIEIDLEKEKTKRETTRPSSFDIFENGGYGYLDPITMQKLFAWIDDFGDEGDSIVSKALDVGIEAGVKNYSYVNGTLKNWYNKGFRTVAEIDANERRRKSKDNNQVKPNVQTTKRSPEEIARLKERNERNMRQMLGGEDVEIITE
ncbi:phage replisome organizer N-terminal domain-containing protein [Macrococcoides caseolyticum]|uniref:phage replisome organizer N-terminal domain-containing protein n=1 Tax=Macrococcoides caseolyticum TaxID=69966 RepID=UPI000C349679|nr:phage replisome organizer N-terminal domain-containing protein [Macrococcus caseolyticus]PKE47937.1 DnaD domain protein [Macrococcus caseolyticus]PKF14884.1 DnaD domain protein [Macrococcus caseolyticus]